MTKVEWTDVTWNPVRGCSRVSAGCENCYAERNAWRHHGPGGAYEGLVRWVNGGPKWTGKVQLLPEKIVEPLTWRTPRRVFVNSMSDLFHESVPFSFIGQVFTTMFCAEKHTFQVLTKRPGRMQRWFDEDTTGRMLARQLPKHIHLGVSVEDQPTADERIPLLLQVPAAVRFASYEPALGPVDFGVAAWSQGSKRPSVSVQARQTDGNQLRAIDWLIVGGESGPGARPCDVAWIRSAVEQCKAAGVPVFVKQDSGPKPGKQGRIPDELWVKEYPNVERSTEEVGR